MTSAVCFLYLFISFVFHSYVGCCHLWYLFAKAPVTTVVVFFSSLKTIVLFRTRLRINWRTKNGLSVEKIPSRVFYQPDFRRGKNVLVLLFLLQRRDRRRTKPSNNNRSAVSAAEWVRIRRQPRTWIRGGYRQCRTADSSPVPGLTRLPGRERPSFHPFEVRNQEQKMALWRFVCLLSKSVNDKIHKGTLRYIWHM